MRAVGIWTLDCMAAMVPCMSEPLDCLVCGSCVVDLLCRPVRLDAAIGAGVLHETEPVLLTGGGITLNAGATMSRLGMRVGVFSYVGADAWAPVVHQLLQAEGIDADLLLTHPSAGTSTTVVMVDRTGERSFFHSVGAPQSLDADALLARMDIIRRTRIMLLGYYSLMPRLEPDLPAVFRAVRETGCRTAMDAAGSGGTMRPLDRILPQLDIYVPSRLEAEHQTGLKDPARMIAAYRGCGAPGLLGVKLGLDGVLLSPHGDELIHVPVVTAPGEVVDTTGAGDSFYAGLLTGLLRGLTPAEAGRLGAAAAACCVTAVGGGTGGRDWPFTARLAGLKP